MAANAAALGADPPPPFPADPAQSLERSCFQTGQAWSGAGNLRSDVAIAYGIDPGLGARIGTWRDRGYRIHVMTGVAWGGYQDYIQGRFDGVKHEDEVQTDREGRPHRHGDSSDVFYMCPGTNYGNYLCVGVRRALDAGAEAIHLEEPEFWVEDGYGGGFKREWRSYYGEDWQPPHSSVDAQWRASKLKYFLYRRALQQIFDYVRAYNRQTGRQVRCYVPTHSLLNYAHWRIVSPESSLAQLDGCDGYIAQVWTGTARTANLFRGRLRERTFETAFLEYGAMQNLVRATGRAVWYLNDPVEDDPRHDWEDYRRNWESTLVASLFQPEVWRFEVAPWPERVFRGRYPTASPAAQAIPAAYATELQIVFNALNGLNQPNPLWDCGTPGVGLLTSDSLMFERGQPSPSDPHLTHVYGLALPLLERGVPITPVQLENVDVPAYLDGFRVLVLSYQGQKPLRPEVHERLAAWVRAGGALVVYDDDADPYNRVREWWNTGGRNYATPREHLFELLGVAGANGGPASQGAWTSVGKGGLVWRRQSPVEVATAAGAEEKLVQTVKDAAGSIGVSWRETGWLLVRRGPYVVASGLEESGVSVTKELRGRWVNLFDPELRVQHTMKLGGSSRLFLLDLEAFTGSAPRVLASACKALPLKTGTGALEVEVEGVPETGAIILCYAPTRPRVVTIAGSQLDDWEYSATDRLLWIRFPNEARPRHLKVLF